MERKGNFYVKYIKEKLKNNNFFYISLLILIVTNLFLIFFFRYFDSVSYTVWSVNFWDLLYEGRLNEFYTYAQENIRGAYHPMFMGNYFTIFPWIIWNFPLWITHYFNGNLNVTTLGCIGWSKTLLLLANVITAFYSYRICVKITNNKNMSKWIIPFILGSTEMMISIGYAGQDEIVYLAFFIMSIFYRMEQKKKIALILDIMTITICPIMILPIMALYLLYEKNIVILLIQSVVIFLPNILFNYIYANDPLYLAVKNTNVSEILLPMINSILIPTAFGPMSISVCVVIFIYFICYFTDGEKISDRRLVYILTCTIFVINFLMTNKFYRFCLYIPFFCIILFINENRNINTFLFFIITGLRSILCVFSNMPQNMNKTYIMPEILHFLRLRNNSVSLAELFPSLSLWELFHNLAIPVLYSAAFLFLIINNEYFKVRLNTFPFQKKISTTLYFAIFPAMMVAFTVMIYIFV